MEEMNNQTVSPSVENVATSTQEEKKEEFKIIKPKIIKLLLVLEAIVSSIWVFFFIAWLLGSFVFVLFGDSSLMTIILVFIAMFFITIYINYWLKKRALEKVSYKFYDNRIEYYDWFLVKNRKTIKFSRITDVWQKRGIIERIFWLGTVDISTSGTTWYEISMSYLDNPDGVYDWLDNIVSKYDK